MTVGETPQALLTYRSASNVSEMSSAISAILKPPAPLIAKSLDLRRRVRETVGDTPQTLRDLSVSLERVGDIERALGNLEAARALYRGEP